MLGMMGTMGTQQTYNRIVQNVVNSIVPSKFIMMYNQTNIIPGAPLAVIRKSHPMQQNEAFAGTRSASSHQSSRPGSEFSTIVK